MRIKILYEDNHLLVAIKPAGILSQGDGTNHEDMLSLLKMYLKAKYQKKGNVYLGLVHRLDQPTGGVMVFAKTSKAAARLSSQIRNHLFEKEYLLICRGLFQKKEGEMVDFLTQEGSKIIVSKKGKEAILHYQVLSQNRNQNCSFVKVFLKTGRKHQIRVQFAHRDHPLVGDHRYGYHEKEDLCLFATSISFLHPITNERLTFQAQPKSKGMWTLFTM